MRARWGLFIFFPLLVSIGLLVASQLEFLKNSFHKDLGLGRVATDFGLANYAALLHNTFYQSAITTTLRLSLYATVLSVLLAYPVAYTIARMRSRWTMLMIAGILLASLVTVPIKVLGLLIIFNRQGMLNRFLLLIHATDSPVTLLGNEAGVVVGLIYYSLAFAVLLLYSVIKTIPVSLENAAKIHGCGPWRAFWKVVFPLSIPGIVAVAMTVFNLSMGGFAAAALMGGGRVLTLPVLIQRTIILEAKYGVAATLSVILLTLVLAVNIVSVLIIAYGATRRRRKVRQGQLALLANPNRREHTETKVQSPHRARRLDPGPRLWTEPLSDFLRSRAHRFRQRVGASGDWLRDHGIRLRILTVLNRSWVASVYVFLFAPLLVIAVASLNGGSTRYANIAFPPAHISLDWYLQTPQSHIRAFGTSIVLGVLASAVALLLALPASLGLVRGHLRGRELAAAMFRVPLQIPFIIVGISFLSMYYAFDARTGLTLANTFLGLAVAHVFILMPYIINAVTEVLRRFNTQLEEAALVHGASRWRTFSRVTLPVIAPGIFAGTVYAFMVSFSDVPIALFLASPSFTPLPMLIYQSMEVEFDATLLSTSTAVIIVGLGSLLLLQKFIGLGSLLRSDASAVG